MSPCRYFEGIVTASYVAAGTVSVQSVRRWKRCAGHTLTGFCRVEISKLLSFVSEVESYELISSSAKTRGTC